MLFQLNPRDLEINLSKDCYSFDNESALGKTYLFGLLNLIGNYGMARCCCITFQEQYTSREVIEKLLEQEYDYIFLDRFDLYATDEICRVIEQLRWKCIIFMDIKNLKKVKFCFPEFAGIRITKERIEVF